MFTQARALITGAIILVLLIIAAMIYWRGSSNQEQTQALGTARNVITAQRETAKIERETDIIVNHETQQTATQAQEADNEIQAIRESVRQAPRPRAGADALALAPQPPHLGSVAGADDPCDAGCARILQLAEEARAAARASSASLQPAGAGTR